MKIKSLPPSLMPRRRYIAFEIEADEPLAKDEVIRAIIRESMEFLGENALSDADIKVVDFDEASQRGFLACRHKAVDEAMASLAVISSANNKRACAVPLGVSGTIKALKRKFLKAPLPAISEVDFELKLMGGLRVARRRGELMDAIPTAEELRNRTKDLNVKYIGLVSKDTTSLDITDTK